ncbi:MAG: hypothetical protein LBD51_07660, partial [Bifidobacteriaceae bacterium]|nr:hypothetical protein [Bifidobacteriaceae bacterium]
MTPAAATSATGPPAATTSAANPPQRPDRQVRFSFPAMGTLVQVTARFPAAAPLLAAAPPA